MNILKEVTVMKRFLLLLCLLSTVLIAGVCYADTLTNGAYLMNDGNMEVRIDVNRLPDGKYFINAMGTDKSGKTCRIGDLAEVTGNKLVVGICQIDIVIGDKGIELKDSKACVQCDQGAYISGKYVKQ